jgi:hypothetical protein
MSKQVIICCDGTWNSPDQKDRGQVRPSNVAKIALAILSHDANSTGQKVFNNSYD